MRIYVDASVVIAAMLSSTGGSSLLLFYIRLGTIAGITSQTVVDEVLSKSEKLKKSAQEIEQFIASSGLVVRERLTSDDINTYQGLVNRDDAHVIAGAVLTGCSHLLTLDKKHLLRPDIQKKFSSLKIVSPKDLLKEIVG